MEKKDLRNKLISIGLILYFGSFFLFGLADIYWSTNYWHLIYETSFWIRAPTILGFIIGGILYIIAIILIVVGGLRTKIKIDYWFVITGLFFLGNSLSSLLVFRYFNSILVYLIIPMELFYALIALAGVGIISVITGGLMKPFDRRKDI